MRSLCCIAGASLLLAGAATTPWRAHAADERTGGTPAALDRQDPAFGRSIDFSLLKVAWHNMDAGALADAALKLLEGAWAGAPGQPAPGVETLHTLSEESRGLRGRAGGRQAVPRQKAGHHKKAAHHKKDPHPKTDPHKKDHAQAVHGLKRGRIFRTHAGANWTRQWHAGYGRWIWYAPSTGFSYWWDAVDQRYYLIEEER
jgi:hypothetical protein